MKRIIKIIFLYLIVVLYCFSSFATEPAKKSKEQEQLEYERCYNSFMEALAAGENVIGKSLESPGRLFLFDGNDKLIIGCSPVTFTYIFGKPYVESFKYDLVGFGSTVDSKMLDWFKLLDKKYNKVVVWGQVNDIFSALEQNKELDENYFHTLDEVIDEANKHLKPGPNSKLIFINVKEISEHDDVTKEYAERFNKEVKKVNDYIRLKGIPMIRLKYDTDKTNSDWYLHYTNPYVFQDIFCEIENLH